MARLVPTNPEIGEAVGRRKLLAGRAADDEEQRVKWDLSQETAQDVWHTHQVPNVPSEAFVALIKGVPSARSLGPNAWDRGGKRLIDLDETSGCESPISTQFAKESRDGKHSSASTVEKGQQCHCR